LLVSQLFNANGHLLNYEDLLNRFNTPKRICYCFWCHTIWSYSIASSYLLFFSSFNVPVGKYCFF